MTTRPVGTRSGTRAHPAHCSFYVADDIRVEQGGKPSLLGFFPDNVVIVPLPKAQNAPTKDKPIAIPGLAFLLNFSGVGTYSLEMEFRAPNNVTLMKAGAAKVKSKGSNFNIMTRLQPFIVTSFGIHNLIARVNKKSYTFPFEIRRGQVDPLTPPSLKLLPPQPTTPKKKLHKKKTK